ncbi:N-acetylglucosamine-6-phosphate deacetylase [Pseudalkalibacillus sp. A8]|uniref:N-acetylglucosamine-6-phosphate deacetylase n=1 Tax=Pseudalkalibacillus sp. A8 TaxID=3382641 RepID=UPI0038B5EA4A
MEIQGNLLSLRDVTIQCSHGRIQSISKQKGAKDTNIIIPGMIDTHIHGLKGKDFMDANLSSYEHIARNLVKFGVTGFLATTRAESMDLIKTVLKKLVEYHSVNHEDNLAAQMLGIHLEGPWLNPEYRGAQKIEHIQAPKLEDAKAIYAITGDLLKVVTLAPEVKGMEKIIRFFRQKGVQVSAGHTDAGVEEFKLAYEQGITRVTHSFNAMRGLNHRLPGIMAPAMLNDNIYCEIIADGIHVHPLMIRMLIKQKPLERLILVSDSSAATGLEDGTYYLGGKSLVKKNRLVLLEKGQTIAGSAITLLDAVRFLNKTLHIKLENIIYGASTNPALSINLSNKGEIRVGYDADVVLLDRNLNVHSTFIGGKNVFLKED